MKSQARCFSYGAFAGLVSGLLCLMPAVSRGAAGPEASGAMSLEDQEREIDKQHLRQIHQAIQAYRGKKGELPNWLSDLVPDFLPDPKVLMSPVELRTGRSVLWGYGDPKVKSSYIYEFNQSKAGGQRDQDIPMTMKEWKLLQMEEFGPAIPMLRCHLHDPILNLSYSGDVYETGLFWESDTNTLALMDRLGPGPGAKNGRKLEVSVVDGATRKTIEGAQVYATNRQSEFGPLPPRRTQTQATGRCEVNLGGKRPKTLALEVTKPGFARAYVEWPDTTAIPQEWTAELGKAVTIGGEVRARNGEPVSGATVIVSGLVKDVVGQMVPVPFDSVRTDAAGKWQSAQVPERFDNLSFVVSHPELIPAEFEQGTDTSAANVVTAEALVARTASMELEPGIAITGTVADDQGKPISSASVYALLSMQERSELKRAKTDGAGRYRFVVTEPGAVTLAVEAKDFAPKYVKSEAQAGMPAIGFTLEKGRAVRGKVSDKEGKPIAGVAVQAASWAGRTPLSWGTVTDGEGKFQWSFAPKGRVMLGFSKEGLSSTYHQASSNDVELAVVMTEPFQLSGKVLDAETGEPIQRFTINPGHAYGPDEVFRWERGESVPGTNGTYSITGEDQRAPRVKYAAHAPGYHPAMTPAYEGEGRQSFDFKLKRGIGIRGVLESADGSPLAGATVVLLNRGESAYMDKGGEFREGISQGQAVKTDDQGRFQFQPDLEPQGVVVAHQQGYAAVDADQVAATGKVKLEPWGRVKGSVKMKGDESKRLVALHSVHYQYEDDEPGPPRVWVYLNAEPDEEGSFRFEKVPPGERKVYVQYKLGEGLRLIPLSHGTFVNVMAGETSEVVLGGMGRLVVGRAQVEGPGSEEVNWLKGKSALCPLVPHDIESEAPYNKRFDSPEERTKAYETYAKRHREYWRSEAGRARQREAREYILLFNEEGSFQVDSVPPGRYTLHLIGAREDDSAQGRMMLRYGLQGASGATLAKEVVIPEPDKDGAEPFDLGTFELKMPEKPARPPIIEEDQ